MLASSPRYHVYPMICSDSGSERAPCLGLISVTVIILYLLECVRNRSSSNLDKRELSTLLYMTRNVLRGFVAINMSPFFR